MIPGTSHLALQALSPVVERAFHVGLIRAAQTFGTLVVISPDDFVAIVDLQETPVVVRTTTGTFRKRFVYLTTYQGLAFCTRTIQGLELGEGILLIEARKMFLPV